jgi:hypothetical protein
MSARESMMNLNTLLQTVRSAWAERRARGEFQRLRLTSPQIAEAVAREAGTSPSELALGPAAGRHASQLRERMLAAFGIQPNELSLAEYGALRQTGVACSLCNSKRRCAIELQRGTARANAASFCPNAPTFEALIGGVRQ